MAANAKTTSEPERLIAIETRMDTFVTQEQHQRDVGDIKVMLAEMRGDIKNLKWQLGVIVAVLSSCHIFSGQQDPHLNCKNKQGNILRPFSPGQSHQNHCLSNPTISN